VALKICKAARSDMQKQVQVSVGVHNILGRRQRDMDVHFSLAFERSNLSLHMSCSCRASMAFLNSPYHILACMSEEANKTNCWPQHREHKEKSDSV